MSKPLTVEELKSLEESVSIIRRYCEKTFFGFPRTTMRTIALVHQAERNEQKRSGNVSREW